jgi:hypothetical protein
MKFNNDRRGISRQCVINKLRELGYSFHERKKRVEIWRRSGSTHRVLLDTRKILSELYVRTTLGYCGISRNEIEEFINSAKY